MILTGFKPCKTLSCRCSIDVVGIVFNTLDKNKRHENHDYEDYEYLPDGFSAYILCLKEKICVSKG